MLLATLTSASRLFKTHLSDIPDVCTNDLKCQKLADEVFCESDSLEEDDIAYSIGICQALNKIEIELCYNCIVLNSSGDDAAYAMALSEAYEEECKEVAGIVDSEALAPASSPWSWNGYETLEPDAPPTLVIPRSRGRRSSRKGPRKRTRARAQSRRKVPLDLMIGRWSEPY